MRRLHSKMLKKTVAAVLSVAMVIGTMNLQQTNTYAVDRSKWWLLSTNRPAYSSSANGGDVASFATDGKYSTQWGAAANKADQWLDVDLGGKADISKVVIDWQNDASYGVAYQVLVSDDEINWKKVYETTTGNDGDKKNAMNKEGTAVDYSYYEDVLSTGSADKKLTQSTGRYVRVLINYSKSQSYSDDKKSGWGASIREIEVYGIGDENCVQPVSDAANIALNKEVKVTSYAQPWWASKALDGSNAVDGDYESYWLSQSQDSVKDSSNQALTVDLKDKHTIGRVKVQWQTEYGKDYDVMVSTDGNNWTTVKEMRDQDGSDDTISFTPVSARYVKIQGIKRGTGYGYSLYSMEVFSVNGGSDTPSEDITGKNLAENKEAYSSSKEGDNVSSKYAVDGNDNTRWSSKFADDEWMYVDLGKNYNINKVVLTWENAYGKDYNIQVSTDGNNWTTVKEMRKQNGGEDTAEFKAVNARYVKFQGIKRVMGYGYSIWKFEVYAQ
ncbi:f5/8 type C domain protein [Eubacterium sp. CAG:192]|nr:f5/8 type C domain protein [Eubacterium sp. CAG:192]